MWLTFFVLAYMSCRLQCANILAVLPFPSASYHNVNKPILQELLNRGHNITIITTIDYNFNERNVTQIYLRSLNKLYNNTNLMNEVSKENYLISVLFLADEIFTNFFENVIIQSKNCLKTQAYDLIILEAIHPLVYGFCCTSNVPTVGISANSVPSFINSAIGNPLHFSLHPELFFNIFGKFTFYQRFKSVLLGIAMKLYYHMYALPRYNDIVFQHFGSCPNLHDLQKNMSILLFNNNPFTHRIRPLVPTSIEMGSFLHIQESKALPQQLQAFLDGSSNGVIYFSLGSVLNSCNLPKKTITILLETFEELSYNVIWRADCVKSITTSRRILVNNYFPQQDLLRHKNVKVFITHGGLQSIEEAVINEIPIIGMPLILDQSSIIQRMMELGVCLGINYKTITKNDAKNAIMSSIANPIYKNKIVEMKNILLDRPQKGVDTAVWWIEYVLRHNGTKFLRSQEIDMSLWEYYYIDVAVVFFVCVLGCIFLIQNVFKACCITFKTNKNKVE